MGNSPICPICGESVADYKGPCPKPSMTPSPPTMADQSAEVDQEAAKEYADARADGRFNARTWHEDDRNLARAYLARCGELRGALAREAVMIDAFRSMFYKRVEFQGKSISLENQLGNAEALAEMVRGQLGSAESRATAAEARCAELVKALGFAKIAGSVLQTVLTAAGLKLGAAKAKEMIQWIDDALKEPTL